MFSKKRSSHGAKQAVNRFNLPFQLVLTYQEIAKLHIQASSYLLEYVKLLVHWNNLYDFFSFYFLLTGAVEIL